MVVLTYFLFSVWLAFGIFNAYMLYIGRSFRWINFILMMVAGLACIGCAYLNTVLTST